jgi:ABC-type multidrug transport system ATPase subunit
LNIQDLKKTFSNGLEAVKDLTLKMYSGQIFALLGHNGAGKTTTISMITGLLAPTSGSATVFGDIDVFAEIDKVRQFLGVCPQHNVLFDMLTAQEHLEIFCDFKGNSLYLNLITHHNSFKHLCYHSGGCDTPLGFYYKFRFYINHAIYRGTEGGERSAG